MRRQTASLLPLVLLFIACSSDPATKMAGEAPLLQVEAGRLVDGLGREVLLRGINARVHGLFDVTFDDGRTPLEEIPPFTVEDCRFLSETVGMNLLRLPVNWSGIEPLEGSIDTDYLDRIGDLVDACGEVGVYTIVDLHQDAYGKDIGEDGAPLWAIHPPPPELLEGPLTAEELARRRLSLPVLEAFASLYANAALASGQGVRDAYVAMATVLARSLADHPHAVALELHNEPVVFGDQPALDAFHDAVTEGVRAVAPDLPVVFEPDALRNITDSAPMDTPFGWDNAIYGPHIYTDVFEDGWASEDTNAIRTSVSLAADEARFHDAHLFIGEFGNDPRTDRGRLYLDTCLAAFDDHRASWALWLYEEHSQDAWGLWNEGSEPHTRGTLREEAMDLLARPQPVATAGRLSGLSWDAASATLTVGLAATFDAPHVITVPQWTYPDSVIAHCDGVEAQVEPLVPGRVEVRCAGSLLTVAPAR